MTRAAEPVRFPRAGGSMAGALLLFTGCAQHFARVAGAGDRPRGGVRVRIYFPPDEDEVWKAKRALFEAEWHSFERDDPKSYFAIDRSGPLVNRASHHRAGSRTAGGGGRAQGVVRVPALDRVDGLSGGDAGA